MTKTNMDLPELLAKHDQGDFLRGIAEAVLQLIMEADVEGLIGAGRHERSGERTTWRNGYRERALDTRLGTLNLRVPKLRQGSYFPGFLEARKTSEQALVAVIQEAWIGGVSTRRVDELVQAMGLNGISKSTVSKLCKDIDERVGEFLNRPLTGEWPYVWLDATYLKVRQGGRIVPVGTTALRLLESAAGEHGRIRAFDAETAIFITPGYRFRAADLLLSNFHLPRSTLFMLVAAFSGLDTMKAAYTHAVASGYRFYSYGDACLLYPAHD